MANVNVLITRSSSVGARHTVEYVQSLTDICIRKLMEGKPTTARCPNCSDRHHYGTQCVRSSSDVLLFLLERMFQQRKRHHMFLQENSTHGIKHFSVNQTIITHRSFPFRLLQSPEVNYLPLQIAQITL